MEFESTILKRRLIRSGIAFSAVIFMGTVGYQLLVENATWFDSLYMTFVTVTTIGFAEVLEMEGNVPARIFTIFTALCGIGILTYTFSNLAALIIESDFNESIKKKRMEKIINKLNNHYIICGGGNIGMHVAKELEKTQRPFVIGDLNEQLVEELNSQFKNGYALTGDCSEEQFLSKLNIENAKGVFVTTKDDHHNLMICLTAHQISPKVRIVCHCRNPRNERKLLSVGAHKVISPYFIGGLRMASEMVRPAVTTFLDEMLRDTNLNLRIEEVNIGEKYAGKVVGELPINHLQETLILAIKEKTSWKYNPPKNHIIQNPSQLIVMTSPEEYKELEKAIGE